MVLSERRMRFVAAVFLLLFLASSTASRALNLNNVQPAKDTYILENAVQATFGSNMTVLLGNVGNTSCTDCAAVILLHYDLSGIPQNATVNTVTLSFQKQSTTHSGEFSVSLRRRLGAWAESASWSGVRPDLDPVIGSATINAGLSFPSITDGALKTIVTGWIADPASNHGLAIYPEEATHTTISFYGKESSQGNPIRLSVSYSLPPTPEVTPASADFGTVALGMTTDRSFTIRNAGGGTLTGTATASSPFSVVSGGSYSLAAGQSQAVTVRFTPAAAQSYSGTVTFSGGAGATAQVAGTGAAAPAPLLSVAPSSRTFGSVAVGSSADLGFTVQNTGGGTLSGSASVPAPFSIISGSPYNLTAGQSVAVWIRFAPAAAQSYGASVTFSGGNGATAAVTGTGTGSIPAPDPSWLRVAPVSQGRLDLLWEDNSSNEEGFKVERKEGCCGPWTEIVTLAANSTSHQSTGLTCNTAYAYRVWAYNASGSSGKTNEAAGTTSACSQDTVPTPAPSWLRVSAVSPARINLQWDDNSPNENGFKVERKEGCCGPWTVIATLPADSTTYQSTGLACGTTYAYRVWAFNTMGDSQKTNEAATATPDC